MVFMAQRKPEIDQKRYRESIKPCYPGVKSYKSQAVDHTMYLKPHPLIKNKRNPFK